MGAGKMASVRAYLLHIGACRQAAGKQVCDAPWCVWDGCLVDLIHVWCSRTVLSHALGCLGFRVRAEAIIGDDAASVATQRRSGDAGRDTTVLWRIQSSASRCVL